MASPTTYWGVIRAFYADRGFGFIIPDFGGEDVFVHRSLLGPHILSPGVRVEFTYHHRTNGKRICNGVYTIESSGGRYSVDVKPLTLSDWTGGRVKMYDVTRGFGFVTMLDGSGDAYFNSRWLRSKVIEPPKVGDLWRVRYRRDDQMRMSCVDVEVANFTVGERPSVETD